MVDFTSIKQDYEEMRQDFDTINCTIRLSRGMKTRRQSSHDIDITVTMRTRKKSSMIEEICWKWNDIFVKKYGLTLDISVCRKTNGDIKHIYDFDYRSGLADRGYPVFLGEKGEKRLDGEWVPIDDRQNTP